VTISEGLSRSPSPRNPMVARRARSRPKLSTRLRSVASALARTLLPGRRLRDR
jgi:hypothetical protein